MKFPLGYTFSGLCSGIKVKRHDLGLVFSEVPAVAAGCLTQSRTHAASVAWNRARLPSTSVRAIVVNSGNANCLAGPTEADDNAAMAQAVADRLGVDVDSVLTCSTGVIGHPLPIAKVVVAAPKLCSELGPDPLPLATAMRTTDLVEKVASRELFLGGARVRVLGVAKGSGMIHPNLATMLAFLVTDAAIGAPALQDMLRRSVDDSFNMITVDRDTSTNDAVIALANGLAKNAPIDDAGSEAGKALEAALTDLCKELAQMIARDGEGARKLVTVRATGGASRAQARSMAKSVIESNLVKAALFGSDPAWGRVAAALGARATERGEPLDVSKLSISLQDVAVFQKGRPTGFNSDSVRRLLQGDSVTIDVDLGDGPFEATAWGCDLSYDYVRINADYAPVLVESPEGTVKRDPRFDIKTPELKSELLLSALGYIERFAGTRAVIKYGGAAMIRDDLKQRFAEDVRLLRAVGLRPIIVHGGGPEISRTLEKLGEKTEFVGGLRVTDEAQLRVVEMVLAGQINKEIVACLARAGARAVGLSGKDGNLVLAKKQRGPGGRDLGFVGEVESVDPDILELLLSKDYTPVISPIGLGADGHTYNINADEVAAEVAIACKANKLIYLSDVPGILAEGLLVSRLSAQGLRARIEDGTITGGMLPKAKSVLRALAGGVGTVHLIDGRVPHNVVSELFTTEGVGTMVREAFTSA